MYIIRTYKEYDTNKYVGAKILDEQNMKFVEKPWSDIKSMLRNKPGSIKNVEIDKYGKLKLRNLNPKHKIKYYNRELKDGLVIDQYCIITRTMCDKVAYVADTATDFVYGVNVTITDIANTLGISDIRELNMYNAYVDKQNNRTDIYVYHGDGYMKLQSSIVDTKRIDNIKQEWNIDISRVTNDGIEVDYIDHKEEVRKAEIPSSIVHIGEFGGFVNDIVIPISVKTLGIECFTHSEYLMSVTFIGGIQSIPSRCFYNSSVTTIKFSCNEEMIGESAFEDSLLKGTVMTGAYIIGAKAFSSTAIDRASLLRVENIGVGAFSYCDKLKKVSIRGNLKIIKQGAFKQCTRLSEINIPKTTKVIEQRAFEGCYRLHKVQVPKTVTIGSNAFPKNCIIERV